jgi:hypothetical protein
LISMAYRIISITFVKILRIFIQNEIIHVQYLNHCGMTYLLDKYSNIRSVSKALKSLKNE